MYKMNSTGDSGEFLARDFVDYLGYPGWEFLGSLSRKLSLEVLTPVMIWKVSEVTRNLM